MEWTFISGNFSRPGSNWAARQVFFGNISEPTEILMTRLAKMSSSKAEPDGDGAAVAALVLQKVFSVFRTILLTGTGNTSSTDKLFRVEVVAGRGGHGALLLTTEIGLLALVAHVIAQPVHGKAGRVVIEWVPWNLVVSVLVKAHILQSNHGLGFNFIVKLPDRLNNGKQRLVFDLNLANRAVGKTECNSCSVPAPRKKCHNALVVENMNAVQVDRGSLCE